MKNLNFSEYDGNTGFLIKKRTTLFDIPKKIFSVCNLKIDTRLILLTSTDILEFSGLGLEDLYEKS